MKTYTPEQLKEILRLHALLVKSETGGKRANLYGADLYGADLRSANLYGANLSGANLSSANLYGENKIGRAPWRGEGVWCRCRF